jgi:hypothetical protein
MSQHQTPGREIPDNPLVLHYPVPKSSPDSETPCAEVSSSGEPPKPPSKRPPTSGEFSFNHESNELLIVNARRRNGLILYKPYHAEFAGPGAAVGGLFDRDCQRALPVGNLSLISPESPDERQRAYLIRRQWVRLTKEITRNPVPLQRAQNLLNQFDGFFGAEIIAQLPDVALALLVGVLPQTISIARSTFGNSD